MTILVFLLVSIASAQMPIDARVMESDPSRLTIGGDCSKKNPCVIYVGMVRRTITEPAVLRLHGTPTGLVVIYISVPEGRLTVQRNIDIPITCECSARITSGGPFFPNEYIPNGLRRDTPSINLYKITVIRGTWGPPVDYRPHIPELQ